MRKIIILFLFSLNVFAVPMSPFNKNTLDQKSGWVSADHPKILLSKYEDNYGNLKKINSIKNGTSQIWSDSYWPRNKGGIAYRWQSKTRPKNSDLLSYKELKKLSPNQLAKLSPAEKYDISKGDYSYKLTKSILRKNPSNAASWTGICHGWAEAAITQPPPKLKTIVNPDKLEVRFGFSDLGGILSHYYAGKWGRVKFLGKRCRNTDFDTVACSGINAGAFHIVLANFMENQRSFILDVSRGPEVWNHPVVGYKSRVVGQRAPSDNASSQAVKEIKIEMEMNYALSSFESWNMEKIDPGTKIYKYWLELDQNNKIVGGDWISFQRPDFAWYRRSKSISKKYRFLFN